MTKEEIIRYKAFLIQELTHYYYNYTGENVIKAVKEKILKSPNQWSALSLGDLQTEKSLILSIMDSESMYIRSRDKAKQLYNSVADLLGGECLCGSNPLECTDDCCYDDNCYARSLCQKEVLTNLKDILEDYISVCGLLVQKEALVKKIGTEEL